MKLLRPNAKFGAVVLVIALLSACADIPDIKPFADATANLATATDKGYRQTEAQLAMLQAENPDLQDQAKKSLQELHDRWKPTKEAMNALVGYTDSLAALADAGNTGKEAANKLTNSFEGLYGAVGQLVPLPGISAGVKTAFDAIGAVNGVIAKMRAHNSLKDAAEDAAPAVQVVAKVLAENFVFLEQLSRSAGTAGSAAVENKHHGLLDYHQALVENDTRITKILSLMIRYFGLPNAIRVQAESVRQANVDGNGAAAAGAILGKLSESQKEVLDQIKAYDPGIPANLQANDPELVKKLEARQKELLEASNSYRAELKRIDPDYQIVATKIVSIDTATRSGTDLFSKNKEAINAWAKAHNDLKLALEQKQTLSFRELESLVKEIADTFDKGGEK
jgi:chromosome segregation ATPase